MDVHSEICTHVDEFKLKDARLFKSITLKVLNSLVVRYAFKWLKYPFVPGNTGDIIIAIDISEQLSNLFFSVRP